MNKKMFFLLVCILGGFAQKSCAEVYKSHEYTFEVPFGWTRILFSVFEPQGDAFKDFKGVVMVGVRGLSRGSSLESFAELSLQEYKNLNAQVTELRDMQVGPMLAKRWIVQSGNPTAGNTKMLQVSLVKLQVSLVKDDRAYLFTYTADLNEFDRWLSKIENLIVSSWSLDNAGEENDGYLFAYPMRKIRVSDTLHVVGEGGFGAGIMMRSLPAGSSLESFAELSRNENKQIGLTEVDFSDVLVGTLPAKRRMLVGGGMITLQVFLVKDDKAYLLSYMASLIKFQEKLPQVEELIKSWKFI